MSPFVFSLIKLYVSINHSKRSDRVFTVCVLLQRHYSQQNRKVDPAVMILWKPCEARRFSHVCVCLLSLLYVLLNPVWGRAERGARRPRLLSSHNTTTCQGCGCSLQPALALVLSHKVFFFFSVRKWFEVLLSKAESNCFFYSLSLSVKQAQLVLFPSSVSTCLRLHQLLQMCHF